MGWTAYCSVGTRALSYGGKAAGTYCSPTYIANVKNSGALPSLHYTFSCHGVELIKHFILLLINSDVKIMTFMSEAYLNLDIIIYVKSLLDLETVDAHYFLK